MCDPATVTAVASLVGAGTGVVTASQQKNPKRAQEAKSPDEGLTEDQKRSRLLAQLAAGASRNNPTGGLAANPNTATTKLGA